MSDTRISLAVLSLAFLLPALSACTTTSVAVGAGAGAAVAASQERGLTGTLTDTRIRAAINILWLKQDSD
ncbi:MAG: phospholipid-binding domain-containing protein, partial [Alphaproteobacteria bacterium]